MHNTLTNEDLRAYCIEKKRFTAGSNEKYNKLFELNSNNASLEELIAADSIEDYLEILSELHLQSIRSNNRQEE